ncbi:MAG: hypothetical protein PT118_03825 [Aphanizomenon gracile PMC644.10]|nr:hypothetical protein [Aphanizomenon gracile PMC644.10]
MAGVTESGVRSKNLLWMEFHEYLRYVDTNNSYPNHLDRCIATDWLIGCMIFIVGSELT